MISNGMSLQLWACAAAAVLLLLGARVVRAASRQQPAGRHWLLRTLALLSPLLLLAGMAVGVLGPYWLAGGSPSHTSGRLAGSAFLLVFAGALTSPLAWRHVLLQRLQRPAETLPFFHASQRSLLLLFVLSAVYMIVTRAATPDLRPWLQQPGLLQIVAVTVAQLVHVAMLSVLLVLPVMAARALMVRAARHVITLIRRLAGRSGHA